MGNTNGSQAFRKANHTEGPSQELDKMVGSLGLAIIAKKRSRYTKASQLRKRFVYE